MHDRMFPQPWQIVLAMRPYENQPSRAGFFFRGSDGLTPTGTSLKEFSIGRRTRSLPIGFDPANPPVPIGQEPPPAPPPPPAPRRRRPREAPLPEMQPVPEAPPEAEAPKPFFAGKMRKALTIMAGVLVLLILAIVIPAIDSGVEETLTIADLVSMR